MPRIPVHHDLAPPRLKDSLTGFYPGSLFDVYTKKRFAEKLAQTPPPLLCPHCQKPIALSILPPQPQRHPKSA